MSTLQTQDQDSILFNGSATITTSAGDLGIVAAGNLALSNTSGNYTAVIDTDIDFSCGGLLSLVTNSATEKILIEHTGVTASVSNLELVTAGGNIIVNAANSGSIVAISASASAATITLNNLGGIGISSNSTGTQFFTTGDSTFFTTGDNTFSTGDVIINENAIINEKLTVSNVSNDNVFMLNTLTSPTIDGSTYRQHIFTDDSTTDGGIIITSDTATPTAPLLSLWKENSTDDIVFLQLYRAGTITALGHLGQGLFDAMEVHGTDRLHVESGAGMVISCALDDMVSGGLGITVGTSVGSTVAIFEHSSTIVHSFQTGAGTAYYRLYNTSGDIDYYRLTQTSTNLTLTPTVSTFQNVMVDGAISGTVYRDTSLSQYKDNQRHIDEMNEDFSTDLIYELEPVAWESNLAHEVGVTSFGLVAEDVESVCPDFVIYDSSSGDLQAVKYSMLVIPVIEEMKKLRDRIEALENI